MEKVVWDSLSIKPYLVCKKSRVVGQKSQRRSNDNKYSLTNDQR